VKAGTDVLSKTYNICKLVTFRRQSSVSEGEVGTTLGDDFLGNSCLITLKVLSELLSKVPGLLFVGWNIGPASLRSQNFPVDSHDSFRYLEVESAHVVEFAHV